MQRVPDKIDFFEEENKIAQFWKNEEVFRNSLKQSFTNERFTFYDGPPFATGLPHYGHVLAGTVKDIVTRFAHQSGHYVSRRFGWDCHGLPVEYEIDKLLNIQGPKDVLKMGIDKYNAECRKIVMRYANEWEIIMGRLARWVDFEYDYKTLYPWYMESIWWVFHELYIKGLVYKGVKVMPYSTACNTPLSNFESGQNYKDVVDPQITVGFPLMSDPNVQLVAWTTTPWTLPSNLTLCVNPELTYVKVKALKKNEIYILMEARLCQVFKNEKEYQILEKFHGEKLRGLRYEPLFPYFKHLESRGAFQVLVDKYVSDDAGTGVVHQAPYFGEDDYRVCLAAGIISRDQDIICPVDDSGRFMLPVVDFLDTHVKDADKKIIKYLKEKSPRRLVDTGTVKHSYPFCWRSETPLIYKAVPSWFVRVEPMVESLLASSQATYWVPDFVKEKRFGNWLKNARDWAISRNRYWGTPIPLWVSEDGKEVVCVGSIRELERLTGKKVTDLHRESIDELTIPSVRPGMPPLKRVPEVFDCWFESGSMPYAQLHFPFTRDSEIAFHKGFPADFIAEGIDQTRGWFYTLLVISTALFNKAPFKNLIAHGLVLASDGQKMSKRKKNYPDPMEIVGKYGADALRLYLINSPVVRADNLRFKEEGVRDVLKDVLLPWYNAYRYLAQSIEQLASEKKVKYEFDPTREHVATNTMDRWIKSTTQTMVTTVWTEMAKFHLYKVVPILVDFIDQLTNWYIRMNRKRLKGDNGLEDCLNSIDTLFSVLYTFVRIMAPFTPYLCELMFDNLRRQLTESSQIKTSESVHYLNLPKPIKGDIDVVIERRIKNMQHVISSGRIIRDKRTVPMKYPLPELTVIHKDEQYIEDLKAVENYILEELNLKNLVLSTDCDKYKVALVAEVDHKVLGARLKGDFKSVLQAVKQLTDVQVQEFLKNGSYNVLGHTLGIDEVFISYRFEEGSFDKERYETLGSKEVALVFDMKQDSDMLEEGLAREVVNLVQKLRKKGGLVTTDPVSVFYEVGPEDKDFADVISSQSSYIEKLLKAPFKPWSELDQNADFVVEETSQLKGSPANVRLRVLKRTESDKPAAESRPPSESTKRKNTTPSTQVAKAVKSDLDVKNNSLASKKSEKNKNKNISFELPRNWSMTPCVRYVLIKVHEKIKTKNNQVKNGWVIPLENPLRKSRLTDSELKKKVVEMLGVKNDDVLLYVTNDGIDYEKIDGSSQTVCIDRLGGKILYVCPKDCSFKNSPGETIANAVNFPNQPFVNVEFNGEKAIVFLMHPDGKLLKANEIISAVADVFKLDAAKVVLGRTFNEPKNNLTVALK